MPPRQHVLRVTTTVLVLLALVAVGSAHAAYHVRPGDTLSAIAAALGFSVRDLANLNGLGDPDRLRVGQVLTVPDARGGPSVHVVRSGETLSSIAARYDLSARDLAAANGIVRPDRILAGTQLRLQGGPPPAVAAHAGTHVVQRGETLSHIARRYGVSVTELATANRLADPDRIRAGTTLTVPRGWRCPVAGSVRFINDFGLLKPDGRVHEGVDVFAPRGTPVVAPVPGVVRQSRGGRGGLQVWLRGDDGHSYVGTHLDAFGAAGNVPAGAQIGTVGTSGNAAGTRPHLHFEFHPGGGPAANPYPLLLRACG